MDYWLDYSATSINTGATLEAVCVSINDFLALRTFLVGYTLTIADICAWGQLGGGPRQGGA